MGFERLTEYMDSLAERYGVPGADLKITRGYETVYRYSVGYTNYDKTVPVSADDMYNIYSGSKPITMAGVMQLIESGRLSLDDRLDKYLPEFAHMRWATDFTFGFPFAWPVLLPILVAGAQYLQTKLMTSRQQTGNNNENPMGNSMKMMNIIMPLMIGFMAISFPAFLGLYWLVQSLVMMVQQILINKALDKKTNEELIKENIEKANKKRARKGQPPISDKASISTRYLDRTDEIGTLYNEYTEYYQSRSAAPGSLAAKANMVRDYNERNKK